MTAKRLENSQKNALRALLVRRRRLQAQGCHWPWRDRACLGVLHLLKLLPHAQVAASATIINLFANEQPQSGLKRCMWWQPSKVIDAGLACSATSHMTTQQKVLQRMFVYINGLLQPTSLMGAMNLQEGGLHSVFPFLCLRCLSVWCIYEHSCNIARHTLHDARHTSAGTTAAAVLELHSRFRVWQKPGRDRGYVECVLQRVHETVKCVTRLSAAASKTTAILLD